MQQAKFQDHRTSGSGEKVFLGVFTIYGCGGHLGYVISIMSSNFHFQVPESFHTKQSLVQIGTVVSEKIQFEFLYVHDLGPRSRNDLDHQGQEMTLTFNTHISSYIQLDVCFN